MCQEILRIKERFGECTLLNWYIKHVRVATQSKNQIGMDLKNTIFVLFWPESLSN